ncbi:CoxG family protein [Delftia sp. WSY_9]|uniref:CoxG family protein n=1 Tax=Delftia TaxID=80865 RepID=UPI0007736454|nr:MULTISPECIES: carbon monoxide dehydrogenase subunit G [Delftia]MDH0419659.1 carbon monoxide dehydrogenase subunit G [Delftia tsuruhatensis]MPT53728.1 carbon monoxide dehydrogenase [Delftia sp.]OJX12190.1 MAG: carbon monoxide dehydrogenase [Delftia sp. 67-8]QFS66926.1 carbon monoxide dehydrogenase [Delftia tsuruhatensis]WON88392.1 carbon monoxide dehydrogenase subunit G [Delftia sp. UGAL515B_04]
MEMQASRSLAVSQQQAWEALNDPETLKACLAGCDRFEPQGDDQYAVGMAVKVGPVSAKFSGKVTLSDITPPERYRIAFEGQGGVAGFGKGEADVTLTPEPADAAGQPRCLLSYSVQAQVGGKIAQLGQRLIDGAARNMADDFFARFDTLMQQRHPRAAAAPADAGDTADLSHLPAGLADETGHIEPTVDAQAWEHDAAAGVATPLDAAPATEAEERSRRAIPLWCWGLAIVVVLGAGWLLSRY